jgi:aminotransferase
VEMRRAYRRRRNYIHAALTEAGLPCDPPRGAFYIFPYIGHFELSAQDFAMRLLEEENVACVPGTAFGACGEGFLRCSFATGMDDLKEACARIGRFTARLRK